MWMLQVLFVVLVLGLVMRIPERKARLAVVPVVLVMVAYQALKSGLL